MLEIDHVIAAVPDLERAAQQLHDDHGLMSVTGGRHPGHGTGNRIVPLGATYLELMAVLDGAEADTSPMGRWARDTTSAEISPTALCLRTEDIDSISSTLGEEPLGMSRVTPDGRRLSWRLAGLDGMLGAERLPFFIEWEIDPNDHPGRALVEHEVEVMGIVGVAFGDPGERRALVDGVPMLSLGSGRGVQSVTIRTAAGDLTLG